MFPYDYEEARVTNEIIKYRAKRVLIQLPAGLKPEALRLTQTIEKLGVLPIVSADPCYGACDLAISEAESLGVDLIIHYGHSKQLDYERIPTLYVEARSTLNVDETVKKALFLLKEWKKIGLTTTIQHIHTLSQVRSTLLHSGKIVVIGNHESLSYAGQVTGCNYRNAVSIAKDVEAFLFIGGGLFHALGIALSTLKPTLIANPYDRRVYVVHEEVKTITKQRWAAIKEAKKANTFSVLIGLKPGQKKFEAALEVKKKLEKNGKKVCLLAAREISPEILIKFSGIDAYVNTACPRLSLDDAFNFPKPILTVNEASVVIGEISWEELLEKGLFLN